jgi:sugar phosphate permease
VNQPHFKLSFSAFSRFAVGFYAGVLTPTNYMVCSRWATPEERNFFVAVIYAGQNVGVMLFSLAGVAIDAFGWEALFYIPGGMAIAISALVAMFYSDEPAREGIRRMLHKS